MDQIYLSYKSYALGFSPLTLMDMREMRIDLDSEKNATLALRRYLTSKKNIIRPPQKM